MDLDQSLLTELPLQQRQKVCRQIRQRQVQKYLEFEKSDRGRELLPRKVGCKKVQFLQPCILQIAVENFDDKLVADCLAAGCDPNATTGNGTSLLHRCASEDNTTAAELLLTNGANVNIRDDDWWTPLHTACSCDSPEVANILINNGADVGAVDVDGFLPIDHAGEETEVRALMLKYFESQGLNIATLHENRKIRPKELLDYIKSLPLAYNINQLNEDGVTLLHIAAANGYRACLKALFKYNADVNVKDSYGWTPLHVAARFDQARSITMLLKQKADANAKDSLGTKPSALTSSDEIRGLLMKYERKQEKDTVTSDPLYLEVVHDEMEGVTELSGDSDDALDTTANAYEEIKDLDLTEKVRCPPSVAIFRINSKTVRTKHGTISKEDELMEAKTMYEAIADFSSEHRNKAKPTKDIKKDLETKKERKDEEDDGGYVSYAIWKSGEEEKGHLLACMENDNLISLPTIKEDVVLKEIQGRYQANQIYTEIGDVLIAVNPFKVLPYYSKEISLQYKETKSRPQLPPHIYSIAENSYQHLLHEGRSQCHVISGESGAGKSESCKYIIQHLLRVAGSKKGNLNAKINQVNPLLEAFGNAVTVMNDNSSRFGKYVELNFSKQGEVCGARISEYLLEKSRVVHQGINERNFHIFYWMMAGLSHEEIKIFRLENMQQFRYLKSTLLSRGNVSEDRAKFWEVKECLKYIGFSSADIQEVLQTLSIVLHLGEIDFHGVGNNEAAVVSNNDMLNLVSELLEVSPDELGSALIADYTVTRGEQIRKERKVQQAIDCRDALAKALYARLFSWIVNGINQLIQSVDGSDCLQLGILDIFGFENFPQNSFEQICINVANEQIQLYTNDHIFNSEQQDCLLEGIPMVDIKYSNNDAILNLFLEKHTGLLAILDEESMFPKATDKSLATKLHQNTGKKHSEYYKTPRDGGLSFTIVHFAGCVTYDVTGVLEKNRDTLPNSILYTMKTSNRLLIKELFQSRITRTGSLAPSARQQRASRTTTKKSSSPFEFFKKLRGNQREPKKTEKGVSVERKGPSTMAFHFKNSLSDLITKLQAARPHFVRCIKPNTTRSPMEFVPEYVVAQLRYTGISEIVKIRKFGYSLRLPFHEFLNRYTVLVQCCLPLFCPMSDQDKCKQVVQHYGLKEARFGKSKIFLKNDQVDLLEQLTSDLNSKVVKAQAVVKGYIDRQKVKKLQFERQSQIIQGTQAMRKKNDSSGDVTQLLDSLDDVISQYDEALSVSQLRSDANSSKQHYDDDDENFYDDAFSVEPLASGVVECKEEDDMNGHLPRGLPPVPGHVIHFDPSRPPPSPRELYAAGMYQGVEEQYYPDQKKQAPPPPRRNPETRLSTTSTSNYEEMHDPRQSSPYYHGYPQSPQHGNQAPRRPSHDSPVLGARMEHSPQHSPAAGNQSPRHTTHGSPIMKSKMAHVPQSPRGAGNQPFSYGAVMSPKLHHVDNVSANQTVQNTQNGHQNYNMSNTNYPNFNQNGGSPAMNYGKSESVFQPQPHRPAPQGPPPPVPNPQPQYSHSPTMQRHSVSAVQYNEQRVSSPGVHNPKLSLRSKSVPCNPEEEVQLPPPPPLPDKGSYKMAPPVYRSSSPPLPPPPPELLEDLPPPIPYSAPHVQQNPVLINSPHVPMQKGLPSPSSNSPSHSSAPPPPPPLSSIPRKKTDQPQTRAPANMVPASTEPVTRIDTGYIDRNGNQQPPARPSGDPLLLQQITNVQLKKREVEATAADGRLGKIELSALKLRQTSARVKLLERDGIKTTQEEEMVPDILEEMLAPPLAPADNLPSEQEHEAIPQVSQATDLFEKKAEQVAKAALQVRRRGDSSSEMDFDINNIDLNDVPGYTPVTKSTPVWKRDMIEKKNQEKIEEYIAKKKKEKEDAEKWKNVPEWKRKLMMEKEKEKSKKTEEEIKKAAEEEVNRKKRDKEAEEARKAKLREQQEMEKKMQDEMQDVPEWKREVMMKRGHIRNWDDEREDANDQEEDERQVQNEMDIRDGQSPPPPQKIQPNKVCTQKASVKLQDSQNGHTSPTQQQNKPKEVQSPKASPNVQDSKAEQPSSAQQQNKTRATPKDSVKTQDSKAEQPSSVQQQNKTRATPKDSVKMQDSTDMRPPPTQQQTKTKEVPKPKASVNVQESRDVQPSPTHPQTQSNKVFIQKASVTLQNQQNDNSPKKEEKKPQKRCSLDEAKLEEEWDSLPLWKREIMMKRGGAPTNWGDEREEVNEEDEQ